MKKVAGIFVLVMMLFVSSICEAEVIKHNASQYFEEGRKLYKEEKYTQAMITLKKAVEDGDAWAAALIGSIYSFGGDGIAVNLDNAIKWYNKAKEMGYPASDVFTALLYLNGKGGFSADKEKAYSLIQGVEDLDIEDDDFITNIAYQFYANGWGTSRDLNKAKQIAARIKNDKSRDFALKHIADIEESLKALSAKDLISEVTKNQMRFDKKYKGKTITVEGFVGNIVEKDKGYSLTLFGETGLVNPFNHIDCRFSASEEDNLLDLDKGNRVKVEGTYKGKEAFQVGAIVLRNCKIVK